MKNFDKTLLVFLLILIGMQVMDFLLTAFSYDVLQLFGIQFDEKIYILFSESTYYIPNLIFGIILFFYSRNKIKNTVSISILGFFFPVIGLVFYFLESTFLSKTITVKN